MTDYPASKDTVEAFERGEVILPNLDHEAHIYVAWAYLQVMPLVETMARFPAAVRRIAIADGDAEKYNETITVAYLLLLSERIGAASDHDWARFRSENSDLFVWPGGVLGELYSTETLHSSEAKDRFVAPDRQPTPLAAAPSG